MQEIVSVSTLTASVADLGSGAFLPPDQDGKTQIQDRGIVENILDLTFRTCYQFLGFKALKLGAGILLILDPSGMEKVRSGINIPYQTKDI